MNDKHMNWEEAVFWLRSQPKHAQLVRNCFYDDPLYKSAQRYYQSSEWKAVQEILTGSEKGDALDLGAGRGISSYALARDGWRVTSIEPNKSSLVGSGAIRFLAEETGFSISIIEEWGEKLPFKTDSFDLVYCRSVLHHARDLGALCKEGYRILRQGGVFLATREHVISRKEDLQNFLQNHPLHYLYGGENAFLLKEYMKAFSEAGFRGTILLNPFQSDINLYPETKVQLKAKLLKKMKCFLPNFVSDLLLTSLGALNKTPGRLYSFIGRKHT